jgi:4-amino-4-deoxy-L-arabinose transferase-like glycosyltransferase
LNFRPIKIENRRLIALFLLCILLRICWVVFRLYNDPDVALLPDSPSYMKPAMALLQDHQFSIRPGSQRPEFFRTPGYPFFLASIFTIFGRNLLAVCIVQAVLSSLTVIAIYFTGQRLWPPQTGFAAALHVLPRAFSRPFKTGSVSPGSNSQDSVCQL